MKDLADNEEIKIQIENDPLIGEKLSGRYEILSPLGRGGMGVVYKAKQIDTDRLVAIKTLHSGKLADPELIKKFQSEAQAISRVKHPNTVMLYDFGVSENGLPYIVMEYLSGSSLRALLKECGTLSVSRCNNIFQQVCSALESAHNAGLVHKDLKPENIIITEKGDQKDFVYVLDFGLAGLINTDSQNWQNLQENSYITREITGSPPYMSPEQCCLYEAAIDKRSDIYSLGICVFEALTGVFPFKAKSAIEMLDRHVSAKPKILKDTNSSLSTLESMNKLIQKALEKDPAKRQQSALEFAEEMNEAISKDSKRGIALKDRLELDTDGTSENPNLSTEISQYTYLKCPHCGSESNPEIRLCLSCGRSLAAKDDFSKIRASKGDFVLPKIQDTAKNQARKGFSRKARSAMISKGKIWSRSILLFILSLSLLYCIYFFISQYK